MSMLSSVLLFTLWQPPAMDEPAAPVSLSWAVPGTCMAREQALARLHELIPALPESLPETRGTLAITVEIVDVTAKIRFVGPRGIDERTIEGPSCESLAEAAVLVIAVAVEAPDPAVDEASPVSPSEVDEADDRQPIEPQSEPQSEPEPAQREPAPSLPVDPPKSLSPKSLSPARQRVRGHVGMFGGGGVGPLDTGMGTLGLELGLQGHWWRASARGLWIPPRRTLADDPTRIGRYDGGLGGARACVVPTFVRVRLESPICAGIEAGLLRGRGIDTTPNPTTATRAWAAVELGPSLLYVPKRWVALGLELDLVVALLRGGFTASDAVTQSLAPVGVRALARVEFRFP
jgi:hypothetical protein